MFYLILVYFTKQNDLCYRGIVLHQNLDHQVSTEHHHPHQTDVVHRADHTENQVVQNTNTPGEVTRDEIIGLEVVQEGRLRLKDGMRGQRRGYEVAMESHRRGELMRK